MIEKWDLEKVLSVALVEKGYTHLIWKKEVKVFGFTIRKEGFYDCGLFYGKDDPYLQVVDGIAYSKPYVELLFVNGHRKSIVCKSSEEAKMKYDSLIHDLNFNGNKMVTL